MCLMGWDTACLKILRPPAIGRGAINSRPPADKQMQHNVHTQGFLAPTVMEKAAGHWPAQAGTVLYTHCGGHPALSIYHLSPTCSNSTCRPSGALQGRQC